MLRVCRLAAVSAVLLAFAAGCSASSSPTVRLQPLTPPTTPGNDGRPAAD